MSLKRDGVLNVEFEIDMSMNGQYFFRVVASNGKKLCSSESYHNLNDCENAIEIIRNNAKYAVVQKVFKKRDFWD